MWVRERNSFPAITGAPLLFTHLISFDQDIISSFGHEKNSTGFEYETKIVLSHFCTVSQDSKENFDGSWLNDRHKSYLLLWEKCEECILSASEGPRERKRKGEKEIGSEALAETEKIANVPATNQTWDSSKRS